jgi:hypothetical protein
MTGKSAGEPVWSVSSRCEGGACVQVGIKSTSVLVRGSADPDGTYMTLSQKGWQRFVVGVKDGKFDNL